MAEPTGSAPTARVVAVVRYLAGVRSPRTVTEIATALELNRSTVTALVSELEVSGWVQCAAGRRYSIGPGIVGAAASARLAIGLGDFVNRQLDALSEKTRMPVALSLIERSHTTVIEMFRAPSDYALATVGVRIPFNASSALSVMARRSADEQRQWIHRWPPGGTKLGRVLLDEAVDAGFTVCGPDSVDQGLLGRVDELLGRLRSDLAGPHVLSAAVAELASLAGRPYTHGELERADSVAVTYMAAPVFDADAYPQFEIQLGVLSQSVGAKQRFALSTLLRETAAAVSTVIPSSRFKPTSR